MIGYVEPVHGRHQTLLELDLLGPTDRAILDRRYLAEGRTSRGQIQVSAIGQLRHFASYSVGPLICLNH